MNKFPFFECDNKELNEAYRLALACLCANVIPVKAGLLKTENPCLMAGMHYDTPWTRDAAINVYNAMALLSPEVSKNTLMSVCYEKDGKNFIGDQYWDKIIWAIGAYKVYLIEKDKNFLQFAYQVLVNTISELEHDEFDLELGLFRGPAVYGDGVSAYPKKYRNQNGSAAILDWTDNSVSRISIKGHGIPMKVLSTNCVYAESYRILGIMSDILGKSSQCWESKYLKLKDNINRFFWNEKTGKYDYLQGECDSQESLGLSFSILFDIADEVKKKTIVKNTYITKYGIPCVYPCFQPYEQYGYGRHCGTIWPHIQGFWAKAMLIIEEKEKFENELFALAKNVVRDRQFAEIYHPETGEIYGGVQEWEGEYVNWESCHYQTWSATAYLNMILEGIIGLKFEGEFLVKPYLPHGINYAKLLNLHFNRKRIDIEIFRDEKEQIKTNIVYSNKYE